MREYRGRLERLLPVDEVAVKQERFRGDVELVRSAEGERLRAKVQGRDRLVVLDERGEDLTTEGFADLLRRARVGGVHRLVFALGGPYGHDAATREVAWRVVRLSSLVLNHDLARVVLYEQLYRGMTVLRGIPYHH